MIKVIIALLAVLSIAWTPTDEGWFRVLPGEVVTNTTGAAWVSCTTQREVWNNTVVTLGSITRVIASPGDEYTGIPWSGLLFPGQSFSVTGMDSSLCYIGVQPYFLVLYGGYSFYIPVVVK